MKDAQKAGTSEDSQIYKKLLYEFQKSHKLVIVNFKNWHYSYNSVSQF